jgi:formimidoylglutamate deiminase
MADSFAMDYAMPNRAFFAPHALLSNTWAQNVLIEWDERGAITRVQPNVECPRGVAPAHGPVIPAMPNLHSHAFQRAMAGLAEVRGAGHDSFWSWRQLMYGFANQITPQQLEEIATWLYIEMMEAGYTSVAEFHYVHHDLVGKPYADDTEMCQALIAAATNAGIGLTLLPVLYQTSGFGSAPPSPDQRRFIRSTDSMLNLLERLRNTCGAHGVRLGLAPHSLRAVPTAALKAILQGLDALDATAPVHIHIAEQRAEVDACVEWSGARPVQWLLDNANVNDRWCLVHATHMSDSEATRVAATGAVIGLCPTTEANLGDGIFKAKNWLDARGRWGIGSDSHITVNAANELQTLEYSQRLRSGERNVMTSMNGSPHIGTAMMLAAVAGGAQACGRDVAGLHLGQQADWVELDSTHVALAHLPSPAHMLDAHIFASDGKSTIGNVVRAGRVVVQRGQHAQHEGARARFIAARKSILQSLS